VLRQEGMNELKKCTNCHKEKEQLSDFYLAQGQWRSECKQCTIKRNIRYQRRVKAWKHRYIDEDTRRLYMREYYQKNKEKFAAYREEFKKRYPEYYKSYFRKRKEK
jgi:hypothetical protein